MLGVLGLLQDPGPPPCRFPNEPIDWDPNMKWEKALFIRAKSYQPPLLFNGDKRRGRFMYENMVLPAGKPLSTWYSSRTGWVKFDDEVKIPALFDAKMLGWNQNPWMSLTPSEMFTLRSGIKRARGHTLIAGLGLGYQLIEVMKRPQVERVTLIELEHDVVKLILPRIRKQLPKKPFDVIVGDARVLAPKLTADVGLIDIFESYGYNRFPKCPNIPSMWCWGGKVG